MSMRRDARGKRPQFYADPAMDQAQAGKVALRLLHWLVESGRVTETMSLTGPSGETLLLEPRPEQGIVCVWRGSR